MKTKLTYVCSACQQVFLKWSGKCNNCQSWNTIEEQKINTKSPTPANIPSIKKIQDISEHHTQRVSLPGKEISRVLGGGLVKGSVVLFGGEPGVGKSTLMLQLALRMKAQSVLYVTGEESMDQVKLRAERIGILSQSCYIVQETLIESVLQAIDSTKPLWVIIDSIQTMHSDQFENSPGSVTQVRECTNLLIQYAKRTQTPIFIVGHITKDGSLAGPKTMEHMVDVVLQFEGDRNHRYRILRSTKNRYGSTHEIGLYDMQGEGLKEVLNPSEWLLYEHHAAASGVAVACIMEGNQPLLIETQALVVSNTSAHTHRVGNGIDQKRLSLLLAVIEKQLKIPFFNKDVFVNIAGGFKSEDPALDLAIVSAILSSHFEQSIPRTSCFFGEVGLTGEIRPVSSVAQRITTCEKQGFKQIYLSGRNVYKTNNMCLPAITISAFLSLCFNGQKAPEPHL